MFYFLFIYLFIHFLELFEECFFFFACFALCLDLPLSSSRRRYCQLLSSIDDNFVLCVVLVLSYDSYGRKKLPFSIFLSRVFPLFFSPPPPPHSLSLIPSLCNIPRAILFFYSFSALLPSVSINCNGILFFFAFINQN